MRGTLLLLLVLNSHDGVTPSGAVGDSENFALIFRHEMTLLAEQGGGAMHAVDSPDCRAQITSPTAGVLWTASYLIVQWRLCPMEEMATASIIIRVDGQEMTRGHPSAGRFTIHGIANGWHMVEVVAVDDQGTTLDVGGGMTMGFQVERGESLLGSMAKRVQAGEFARIDVVEQPRAAPAENESDQTDASSCSEAQDVTLVTAAINIGRRHGNITFEDDYIGNLRHILSLRCPVVIHLQERYLPLIEPFLHPRAMVRIKEIADLEGFKHAASIEALRTSDTWAGNKKMYNPAKMPHYNALVMSKLYWLADVSEDNPFDTEHFLWIDAGLCVRFVAQPLQLASVRPLLHRFLVYAMHYSYALGEDVHGFPQEAHVKFAGRGAEELLRGNIFGGTAAAVQANY
jgi:hypothetical protein